MSLFRNKDALDAAWVRFNNLRNACASISYALLRAESLGYSDFEAKELSEDLAAHRFQLREAHAELYSALAAFTINGIDVNHPFS
jgi:hypothetical protein